MEYEGYGGLVDDRANSSRVRGDARRELGEMAEELCAVRLSENGWRILDRNWRIRMGEIDLVAMDGPDLVVVEVKAHRAGNRRGPVSPAMAVVPRKQRRLRKLASAWLMTRCQGRVFEQLRFDVVAMTFTPDGTIIGYEHFRNAF